MSEDAHALFATCWTVAGTAAPTDADKRSPLSFRARAEAAAAAGFSGIGLVYDDLAVARDTYGWNGIRTILQDTGMVEFEVEGLQDWWAEPGVARAASDSARDLMLAAAQEVGVRHLKVLPDTSGSGWEPERWAAEFGELARRCTASGTRLALEFLPWANIATLGDGLALCRAAGEPGAGLILDIWHTERGGTAPAEIAAMPGELILGVELSDAADTLVGDYVEDTVRRRRYCGEGDFDLDGFVRAVRQAGWTGSWGVEILSDEHRALAVGDACRRAADTARDVLSSALG